MFKVLIAAILGGVIFFAWNSISWMVLPWHQQTVKHFDNEKIVAEALTSTVEESGIYLLPRMDQNPSPSDAGEIKTNIENANQHMQEGTFAFISLKPAGMERTMEDSMMFALINSIIVSILVVILLSCTSDLGYMARVFFIVMVGLVAALLGHVPNWIWWGFDTNYTIVMIADILIGWFLAGLIIAAFVGREPDYEISD